MAPAIITDVDRHSVAVGGNSGKDRNQPPVTTTCPVVVCGKDCRLTTKPGIEIQMGPGFQRRDGACLSQTRQRLVVSSWAMALKSDNLLTVGDCGKARLGAVYRNASDNDKRQKVRKKRNQATADREGAQGKGRAKRRA
jgi:hypothetical protein